MRLGVPASSWRAMVRHMGPWITWFVLRGAWFVLRGPGTSCGALIHSVRSWFLPRRPASSTGARFFLRGPTSSCRLAGPCLSRGALIRLAGTDSSCGPWFDGRGPDPSRGAPIRIARPWSVPWSLICPAGSWFVLRALICLTGPWFVLRVHPAGPDPWFFLRGPDPSRGPLKPDKKLTSSRGPSGSRRPGFGLGTKRYVGPRWLAFGGHGPNAPPPLGPLLPWSPLPNACSWAHLHISAKTT